jgi:hypothetical protein
MNSLTNIILECIFIMLLAIYYQGEMRELSQGRPKSIVGLICSVIASVGLFIGVLIH